MRLFNKTRIMDSNTLDNKIRWLLFAAKWQAEQPVIYLSAHLLCCCVSALLYSLVGWCATMAIGERQSWMVHSRSLIIWAMAPMIICVIKNVFLQAGSASGPAPSYDHPRHHPHHLSYPESKQGFLVYQFVASSRDDAPQYTQYIFTSETIYLLFIIAFSPQRISLLEYKIIKSC